MKKIIQLLTLILFIASCNTVSEKKETESRHEKLLGFKTSFIAELGEEEYFQLEDEVKSGKIETKFINDIIYVSYYEELNACGKYDGDLEIKNDTIFLKVKLISDEVCTSLSINKVTFLIDNPGQSQKVIIR